MDTAIRKAKATKATDAEKREYAASLPTPCYPLSHWVTVDGRTCPVEYLGGHWDRENPQYEIILPHGFHAKYEALHTMLCLTLKEVAERAAYTELEACTDC
jgi:hypothetical protein